LIHFIVGNTGAGKTTYAQKLKEQTGGVLFSIDKWNKVLFLPDKLDSDGLEWFLDRIERSEEIMMDLIVQLEISNTDVILDLGLSKYAHREKFRKFANRNRVEHTLHFLDIPKDVRLDRVMNRNLERGDTFEFEVTKKNFDFMETWFERPDSIELKNAVIIN